MEKTLKEQFIELLEKISNRPAMYVGEVSIGKVKSFIDGYLQAFYDMNRKEESRMNEFIEWLQEKTGNTETAYGWDTLLVQYCGSEEKAVENLAKIYKESMLK